MIGIWRWNRIIQPDCCIIHFIRTICKDVSSHTVNRPRKGFPPMWEEILARKQQTIQHQKYQNQSRTRDTRHCLLLLMFIHWEPFCRKPEIRGVFLGFSPSITLLPVPTALVGYRLDSLWSAQDLDSKSESTVSHKFCGFFSEAKFQPTQKRHKNLTDWGSCWWCMQ